MTQTLMPPTVLTTSRTRSGSRIAELFTHKTEAIHELIAQIDTQTRVRVALSKKVCEQMTHDEMRITAKLNEFPALQPGMTPTPHQMALHKQLEELRKESRMEQTACWRETAQLQEERRRYKKEYDTLQQRLALFDHTKKKSPATEWHTTHDSRGGATPSLDDIKAAIRAATMS